MEIGYFLLLFMGIVLGLIGAGGSILTIPILVYGFGIPMTLSTTYSLFIVGASACMGVARHKESIEFKRAVIFTVPSLLSVSLSRFYLLPNIPETLGKFSKDFLLMMLLLSVMLLAAYAMIKESPSKRPSPQHPVKVMLIAIALGALMGILGTGGGFLIVPTLVFFLNFDIKNAVATSLLIVMLNAMAGFLSDHHSLTIDEYKSLIFFTLIAFLGMALGLHLGTKISGPHLKKGFGYLIAAIAISIALKELCF